MSYNGLENEKIPFLDLITLHQELEAELVPVFQRVLRTAGFVGGPMVEEFESEFAKFTDAAYCVGLASGTDAVRFALMAAHFYCYHRGDLAGRRASGFRRH